MPPQRIEEIRHRAKWHIQAVLVIAVIVTLLPIIWVLLTSFKPNILITESKPLWVFKPTLEHYESLLTQRGDFDFPKFITNSFIITIATTVFAIVIAYPAAYSIARFKTLGDNFSFWVLTQRMLPPIIFIIPMSILFAMYGLSDTRLGLIIIYLTFNVPFATWIFKSFIEDIPTDLERAAYMDGYSQFQVMTRIIMPLTRSAVVAVTIICFIFSWNEFLFALIISFFKSQTLTVGAAQFVTGYAIRWGKISAATIIAIIPTIVVGFIGQRYLVRGLTMGAVK
jgi:multiple sugar transport system permease protein